MTLHEAIIKVLQEYGSPKTTSEIADILNVNKWYEKKDKSLILPFQIHGRTKKYPQFFERDGSSVFLKNGDGVQGQALVSSVPKSDKSSSIDDIMAFLNPSVPSDIEFEEDQLMDETKFVSAGTLSEANVPSTPGLYCIRIREDGKLPAPFSERLKERGHNIIYIGIASQSLRKRFLGQELRAKGPGTFFRSIGAVLGYRPQIGSLIGRSNQNNYTFSPSDEMKIIAWINENLMVNYISFSGNQEVAENGLIRKYLPLLNLAKNPAAMPELTVLRNECKRIAREE